MQVPKRKTSKSRRDMRRAHDSLTPVLGTTCAKCGEPTRRHSICPSCGYYRGRYYTSQTEQ